MKKYSCMKWVGTKGPLNSEILNVAETSLMGEEYGVILVKRKTLHEDEFVTWEFNANCNNEINCYWGHYFNDIHSATKDFVKRVADLLAVSIKIN